MYRYKATFTFATPKPVPEEVLSELELRMTVQLDYLPEDAEIALEEVHSLVRPLEDE